MTQRAEGENRKTEDDEGWGRIGDFLPPWWGAEDWTAADVALVGLLFP